MGTFLGYYCSITQSQLTESMRIFEFEKPVVDYMGQKWGIRIARHIYQVKKSYNGQACLETVEIIEFMHFLRMS